MAEKMLRERHFEVLTIAEGGALSGVVDGRGYASGRVRIPAAWTAANIGFKECEKADGTFAHAEPHDSASPIQIQNIPTDTMVWKTIPPEMFPLQFFKLWSKSATAATETDVNQAAARELIVVLGS